MSLAQLRPLITAPQIPASSSGLQPRLCVPKWPSQRLARGLEEGKEVGGEVVVGTGLWLTQTERLAQI